MTDVDAYFDYSDQTTVTIRVVESIMTEPLEVVAYEFSSPNWPRDLPPRLIQEDLRGLDEPPTHLLDVKSSYTEWGASGVSHSVVLTLAEWGAQGVVGAIAVGAIKKLTTYLREHASSEVTELGALERSGAEFRLRWLIVDTYLPGQDPDVLMLIEDEFDLDQSEWSFRFEFEGVRYDGAVRIDDGYVLVVRVRRSSLST